MSLPFAHFFPLRRIVSSILVEKPNSSLITLQVTVFSQLGYKLYQTRSMLTLLTLSSPHRTGPYISKPVSCSMNQLKSLFKSGRFRHLVILKHFVNHSIIAINLLYCHFFVCLTLHKNECFVGICHKFSCCQMLPGN